MLHLQQGHLFYAAFLHSVASSSHTTNMPKKRYEWLKEIEKNKRIQSLLGIQLSQQLSLVIIQDFYVVSVKTQSCCLCLIKE